jgi:hypothetical protein
MNNPLRLKRLALILAAASACFAYQPAAKPEAARWKQHAQNVTIIRDDWGIAHVYGKTDADAVFGMVYTQAEDDFNRVETNYINAMGRLAEAEALHRSRGVENAIRRKPGMAEDAHDRLGRRPELLPLDAPQGEAARDPTLRTLDGALLH